MTFKSSSAPPSQSNFLYHNAIGYEAGSVPFEFPLFLESEEKKIVFRPTRFKQDPVRKIRNELNKLSDKNVDRIAKSFNDNYKFTEVQDIKNFVTSISVKCSAPSPQLESYSTLFVDVVGSWQAPD
jgi:hypothetical protein